MYGEHMEQSKHIKNFNVFGIPKDGMLGPYNISVAPYCY